jgi:hypothetical protein
MKMTKKVYRIRLLKAKREYEKKYINPLLCKFTRPPKMFDEGQVRLLKQVNKMALDLREAELCMECEGKGVVLTHLEHPVLTSWQEHYEEKEWSVDKCQECDGNKIIFNK